MKICYNLLSNARFFIKELHYSKTWHYIIEVVAGQNK